MYRLYKILLSLAVVFAVTTYLPLRVHAQSWANDQAASFVIGQTGFGLNASGVTATGLSQPWGGVVIDPATGKVFVSDLSNNRILRYPSAAAMTNGAAAEAVLGQPNFTQNINGLSATTLWQPVGMAMDAAGNLWVADERNNRVLRYANAATIASGSAASTVLGQANFTSSNIGFPLVTASSMYEPFSVFCIGTTLWVADTGPDRVLRFENAASLANGAAASAVFGQPGFTTNTPNTNASGLFAPMQIYVDGADNLWVADFANNRVMMFPNAATAANNEAATLVLGQPDFNSNAAGSTATTFNSPVGVYGDGNGNIYVSDYGNNRILIFANAASLSNGAAATYVLGQTNFTSTGTGDNANQLNGPTFLFVGTSLLAADATNNRIMIWIPLVPLPLTLTSFTGRLQDNGQVLLQWQVSGSGGSAPSGTFELQYATSDTSNFNTVLNTQPVNPAISGYSYLQVSPAPGANYYRLRLIAPDGSFTYSQIVTINVGAVSTGLSIYPNPAHSSIAVSLPEMGGTAMISIYSSTGTLMQWLLSGAPVNTIDISRWAAGMYTVKVVEGNSTMTSSFIKVD